MPHPHRGILLMIVPSFPEIFPIRLRELHDSLPRRPACHTASFLARPRLDAWFHEGLGVRLCRNRPHRPEVTTAVEVALASGSLTRELHAFRCGRERVVITGLRFRNALFSY